MRGDDRRAEEPQFVDTTSTRSVSFAAGTQSIRTQNWSSYCARTTRFLGEPMTRTLLLATVLVAASLSTGCALTAPNYSPSLENVQKIKDQNIQATQVVPFTSEPGKGNANPI